MPASFHPPRDRLKTYRDKRSPSGTPEPFGRGEARPGLFCVQKHAATRMHHDLRLELGGTLRSWAVPRGPSKNPAEKRLAVEVEDHPVEYGDFEGIIPEGNYGAGAVILWDRGVWIPLEDPEEGLAKGKLLFELRGVKMRGVWTLVRTKAKGAAKSGPTKEWLLIKHADEWSTGPDEDSFPQESILSGLTVEELGAGRDVAAELRAEIERLGAPKNKVDLDSVKLMLCETRDAPFSDPAWIYELKQDGFRLLAGRDGNRVKLRYRSGADATATYPDLANAVAALRHPSFVVDGELVVLDPNGRPSFQLLQQRALLKNTIDVVRMATELPATLYLFDLLGYDDFDLRSLPLVARKSLLQRMLPRLGPIRYCDHVQEIGEAFYDEVQKMDLEGVIAKRAESPYRAGRSPDWVKIKVPRTDRFVIVGYTQPSGSRTGFGAIHLATHVGGKLTYAGRVGSGFDDALLASLRARLDEAIVPDPPCEEVPAVAAKDSVWCRPELVCEVRFREWTDDKVLRLPVFQRLLPDAKVEDCVKRGHGAPPPEPAVEPAPGARPERRVTLSNQGKVFWPDDGYTKGDLLEYYRAISPWLLPYLRDRPVMLTRFPDGITGKSFFQRDAPGFVPGWMRTERLFNEEDGKEVDQFVCDDEESLLYLINMGTIPLHIWSSRVSAIQTPDWCILDLDPKGAPFTDVVKLARALHALCEELGLPSFAKTSGASGLHVLIPLGAQLTHEQSRQLAELIARVLVEENPELTTMTRVIADRGGKVYLDWLQNGHGKLLVAPFAVRPLPGAPASTPLDWSEVTARLDPKRFTIRTIPKRMAKRKEDPLAPVLTLRPDLGAALTRLAERVARTSR